VDVELFKVLIGGGIGAAIACYLLIKTIPDLAKTFREESREQRDVFADEMGKQRDAHAREIVALHTIMHNRDEKIIAALSDIQDRRLDE
jgi:hypothetical protein